MFSYKLAFDAMRSETATASRSWLDSSPQETVSRATSYHNNLTANAIARERDDPHDDWASGPFELQSESLQVRLVRSCLAR